MSSSNNQCIFLQSSDPNFHKSKEQLLKEINILEYKIKNNERSLANLDRNMKVIVKNEIIEDKIRLNALCEAYKKYYGYSRILLVWTVVMFILLIIGICIIVYFVATKKLR